MPEAIRDNSEITAIEPEPISAQICAHEHPDIKVINGGFEDYHGSGFDLIVGNPPYGSQVVCDSHHMDLKGQSIHHYFIAKAVRLLNNNGLCAMVVPAYVMDNIKNHARHYIAEHAELVCAYRLPDSLFADAKVTVDIIILRKTDNPDTSWTESVPIALDDGQRFHLSHYFANCPEHIIGQLDSYKVWMAKENRERRGLKCTGSIADVNAKLPVLINKLDRIIEAKPQSADDMKKALAYLHKLADQFNRCLSKMDTCIV